MLNAEILKEAEKVFSIPFKASKSPPAKYDPQQGVKSFLVSAKDMSLETDFSGVADIEDIKSIKLLLVSAYKMAPSRELKVAVSKAGASINTCIKLITKKQSSRFRYSITETTIKSAYSEYLATLSAAIEIITTNQSKADLTFYTGLKQTSKNKTSLPYRMETTLEEYKADILIYSSKPPQTTFKKIEYGCYLIEGTIIAVNTDKYKGTKTQTAKLKEQILKAYGATLHDDPIFRNSQNIKFFLLLDFGINIYNASFVDSLIMNDIPVLPSDSHIEGQDSAITIKYLSERAIESSIRRQKTLRLTFEKENQSLIDAINYNQEIADNLRYEMEEVSSDFRKWCSYPGDPFDGKGLPIADFNKIDSYFKRWLNRELNNENRQSYRMFLRKDLFRLKVKASIEYHHYVTLKKELDIVNNKLKNLIARKEDSMENFALSNGIVSKKHERMLTEGLVDAA